MRKARPIPLLLAVLAAAAALSCGPIATAHRPGNLTGHVVLPGQADRFGVTVRLRLDVWDLAMITDPDGLFTVPSDLSAGRWTVTATFPFYADADARFTVSNGFPTVDLPDLVLAPRVAFAVSTDAPSYRVGDVVTITLAARNVSPDEVTLRSRTSPLAAVAVVQDDQVVLGSLLPGTDDAPEEVTLAAGERRLFPITWTTDAQTVAPGSYQLYAVLAASGTWPDYFSAGEPELNQALFAKLVPAVVELLP